MTAAPALAVEGLRFAYGEREVLRGVSFAVAAGETLAILGANGAGKTTLLACLNRLREPSGGRVLVDGRPVTALPRKELGRLVALVPQMRAPAFDFTIEELVLMGRNPHLPAFAMPAAADRALVAAELEGLGISRLAGRRVTEVSGGELQLAYVARALVQAERAILLDEPVAHLDLRNQVGILSLARRVAARRHLAVVMVLHDPNHALGYADRALLLHDGTVVACGAPGETLTPERIRAVYGVEARPVAVDGRTFLVPWATAAAGGEAA
jgi:iron complex transport system ATP-binding protein